MISLNLCSQYYYKFVEFATVAFAANTQYIFFGDYISYSSVICHNIYIHKSFVTFINGERERERTLPNSMQHHL